MKATQELVMAFARAVWTDVHGYVELDRDEIEKGVQAVLDLIEQEQPQVQPFTFTGYPDNPVYLHPSCGTVVDVSPINTDTKDSVDAGECDCENTMPWLRIYVEKKEQGR